ncbi:MAG TPA: prenyltransferase/squalene oxidase repeat-containing protein [Solirubrobacterales bacterium]
MSWEAVSFLILGVVLLGGFAWYERSRPPSQVVALVAALAALAIAGRIAFAAFPNVKPTTDIVIFAGFALGAAPGFAVGALAALVSNFWFGQGPWTPWQMAGWGLCGVLGAGLAAVGGRNIGRLALAAVCGAAGIAYGALLNFSLMATYGGDLSLERFLAFQSRAIPFDAAHAIGNVAFALIAGPAMVRMLVRFRERFEWGGRGEEIGSSGFGPRLRGGVVALLALFVLASAAVPAPAGADTGDAVKWLTSVQNADGGFGASPGDESSVSTTAWVALGFAAAGRNPLDVSRLGRTPVDFLRSNVSELGSAGDYARTILALEASGVDPSSFGGVDLVATLAGKQADNGSWVGWPGSTAFAVIALRTAGATGGINRALAWFGKVQNDDGGWGDVPNSFSTADGTGAVMQAMPGAEISRHGLGYLRKHQRSNGGFVTGASGAVNSQSTAWAVQGMLAVGADPGAALDYLTARQAADGHYRYSSSSDQTPVWVTGQVLAAVAGKPFPIAAPPREPEPAAKVGAGAPVPGTVTPPAASPTPAPVVPPASEGSGTGSVPDSSVPAIPPAPGGSITPPSTAAPEAEGPAVLPESAPEPEPAATESGKGPSPLPPVGIGLATAGLAIGVPWWLGRRNGW